MSTSSSEDSSNTSTNNNNTSTDATDATPTKVKSKELEDDECDWVDDTFAQPFHEVYRDKSGSKKKKKGRKHANGRLTQIRWIKANVLDQFLEEYPARNSEPREAVLNVRSHSTSTSCLTLLQLITKHLQNVRKKLVEADNEAPSPAQDPEPEASHSAP